MSNESNTVTPHVVKLLPDAFRWGQKPGQDKTSDDKIGGKSWQRNEAVKMAWESLLAQNPPVATVINLMPFRLRQQVSSVGEVTCPPCKFGEKYAKEVIKMPRIDQQTNASGIPVPVAIHQIQLARELARKYRFSNGAVFCYEGEREPTVEELRTAINARQTWAERQFAEASKLWSERKDFTRISSNMRWAAEYLQHTNFLQEIPEWVTTTKVQQLMHNNECEQCGEMNGKKAKVCKFCEFPIDLVWVAATRPDLVAKFPTKFPGQAQAKPKLTGGVKNTPVSDTE